VDIKQQLRTTNDTNGNPRRVWVLYRVEDERYFPEVVAVADEGYAGDPFREVRAALPSIMVTPTEYRAWRKREGDYR
jgi:hypothetical protein